MYSSRFTRFSFYVFFTLSHNVNIFRTSFLLSPTQRTPSLSLSLSSFFFLFLSLASCSLGTNYSASAHRSPRFVPIRRSEYFSSAFIVSFKRFRSLFGAVSVADPLFFELSSRLSFFSFLFFFFFKFFIRIVSVLRNVDIHVLFLFNSL